MEEPKAKKKKKTEILGFSIFLFFCFSKNKKTEKSGFSVFLFFEKQKTEKWKIPEIPVFFGFRSPGRPAGRDPARLRSSGLEPPSSKTNTFSQAARPRHFPMQQNKHIFPQAKKTTHFPKLKTAMSLLERFCFTEGFGGGLIQAPAGQVPLLGAPVPPVPGWIKTWKTCVLKALAGCWSVQLVTAP